jgi:TPP-dependent pyruvate/acetoin dehydrogenase alpha subunit
VTLLEVKTFRLKGHAEHDNQAYVPAELIEEWKAKDALPRFEKVLMELGVAKQEDFAAIQERVKREVDEATDEADRSPMPDPADAARGLYIEDGYWNG